MVKNDGRAILMDVGMTPLMELYVQVDGRRPIPDMWAYKPREQLLLPDDAEGPIVFTTAMDVCSFGTTSYAVGPHPPFRQLLSPDFSLCRSSLAGLSDLAILEILPGFVNVGMTTSNSCRTWMRTCGRSFGGVWLETHPIVRR